MAKHIMSQDLWDSIRNEYVSTNQTFSELAKSYKVPVSEISRIAQIEQWTKPPTIVNPLPVATLQVSHLFQNRLHRIESRLDKVEGIYNLLPTNEVEAEGWTPEERLAAIRIALDIEREYMKTVTAYAEAAKALGGQPAGAGAPGSLSVQGDVSIVVGNGAPSFAEVAQALSQATGAPLTPDADGDIDIIEAEFEDDDTTDDGGVEDLDS